MKISKNTVVSLAYQVHTNDGVLIDEATIATPLEYLHGHHSLIPGLEKALEGRKAGDKFTIDIDAADAYGDVNENLIQDVPKNIFVDNDDNLDIGMRFLADTEDGPLPVEITAINGDTVTIDGNHTLAGQTLTFNVEITAVRKATNEETADKYLHIHEKNEKCSCH